MSRELERLVGKAVLDKDFRKKVMNDATREAALTEAGIKLTPEELDKVKKAAAERSKDIGATELALDTVKRSQW